MQLVRSRTSHIIAIENIAARQRGMKINSNQVKKMTADDWGDSFAATIEETGAVY
jgi:hypothetical protein